MRVEHIGVRYSGRWLVAAAALLIGVIAVAGAAAAEPARDCAELMSLSEPDAVIETATIVPASAISGRPGLPEHCLVQGMLNPRIGADGSRYGVGFDLRMPTEWNGRFVFQGGGGLDGVLTPAYGDIAGTLDPSALERGFAVVSTDGGHRGRSMIDATFAVDQQARVDYAFGAMDSATRKSKALVELYYGTKYCKDLKEFLRATSDAPTTGRVGQWPGSSAVVSQRKMAIRGPAGHRLDGCASW